jgi:hypothetical protein
VTEKDSARLAYQDFFAAWKDADPDIPILISFTRYKPSRSPAPIQTNVNGGPTKSANELKSAKFLSVRLITPILQNGVGDSALAVPEF